MKRISGLLLCVIGFVVILAGCSDGTKKDVNFADCDIGYSWDVYPAYEFNYKIKERDSYYEEFDCIVHIKKMTATLNEKRYIEPDQTLSSPYMPYIVNIEVEGNVEGLTKNQMDNYSVYVLISQQQSNVKCMIECKIGADGNIKGSENFAFNKYSNLLFYSVEMGKVRIKE